MKPINTSGKRKTAVARCTITEGKPGIRINNIPLNEFSQGMYREKVREVLIIAGKYADKANMKIRVHGGGVNAQAEAIRLAIARGLVEFSKGQLEEEFKEYDRSFLVADIRVKETNKPNVSKARAKRQKSYR